MMKYPIFAAVLLASAYAIGTLATPLIRTAGAPLAGVCSFLIGLAWGTLVTWVARRRFGLFTPGGPR